MMEMNKEEEQIKFKKEISRWYKTFLGITQSHTYWLYKVIDQILNEEKQIKGIIEIGTGRGALTIFLGLECYERGYKPLLSYDIERILREPKMFKLLGIKYIIRDCFDEKSINEIKEYTDVPIFLMCDGGDKAKEFNTYAGFLKSGSVIGAHDYNEGYYKIRSRGMRLKFITETVNKYNLKPIHQSEWNNAPDYIKTCFWKKETK